MTSSTKKVNKKIVIIGAGPGGLTAAMILAHRGFNVEIYEKSNKVGGRNSAFTEKGFSFDIGPTFLLQKYILEEMFEEVGREASDYLTFQKLDPMYRLDFKKEYIDMSADPQKMIEEITKKFPGNEEGFKKFMKKESKKFNLMFPCLQRPYLSHPSVVNKDTIKALPYLFNRNSMYEELGKYFKDENLKLSFTFQSKYLGMSPWECPNIFTIIPYIEHKWGIYHVKGGLSKISDAMAKVCEEEGVKIHLNSEIKKINIKEKEITGLTLSDGKEINADSFILNADFAYAMSHLISPQNSIKKYTKEKLSKKPFSCSTFMIYLGLKSKPKDYPFHTILFADDYQKNVKEISENLTPSTDMSIYLRNASVLDETLAPKDHTNLYILVPTINNSKDFDWDSYKEKYRKMVLKRLAERTPYKDLEKDIVYEKIVTPKDWQADFNVFNGAVFNLSHVLSQMLSLRPRNKFESLKNCYLVGGGTHPGSGLPTIYESARISANHLSKKNKIKFSPPNSLKNNLFHENS